MKIKKVEISAFRAFDNIEDSTFDFSLGEGIADFISIYAPNGYGKTSFYDAVEWAITGQISRFQKNAPENKKVAIENRKGNKNQYLLQHNGQKELGFVNVLTNNNEQIFPKREISNTTVYDFNKVPINNYFRDVILTQDLIDTFIKEEKAEDRYKKFIVAIPDLNDYNTGLENIIRLIENIDEGIGGLKSQKEELESNQLEFDFKGDKKVLEEINISINFLIEKKEKLSLIDKNSFSISEHAALTQKIDSAFTQLEIEDDELNRKSKNIQIAFNGSNTDENKPGVIQYYVILQSENELKDKIIKLKNLRNTFELKDASEKEKLSLVEMLDENILIKADALNIEKQYPKYETVQKRISELQIKVNKSDKLHETHKILLEESKLKVSELNIDIKKEQKRLKKSKGNLQQSSVIDEKVNVLQTNEEILLKDAAPLEKAINSNKEVLIKTIDKIENYKSYLVTLNKDINQLFNDSLFDKFKNDIQQIQNSQKQIEQLDKKLLSLNSTIHNQSNLNKELKEFISKGLKLISDKEDTNCPLCLTDFASYNELSESISNNPLLDSLLKSSITERNNFEIQIVKTKRKILEAKNIIRDFLEDLISVEQNNKIKTQDDLEKATSLLERNVELIKALQEEKENELQFFNKINISDFVKKVNEDIIIIQREIENLQLQIDTTKLQIEKSTGIIEKTLKESQLYKNSIKEEKENDVLILIENYFRDKIKSNTIAKSVLDTFITQIEVNLKAIKEKIENQDLKLNDLKRVLTNSSLSKEELNKQIELSSNLQSLNIKVLRNFENFINSEFKINLLGLSQQESTLQFEAFKTKISDQINTMNEIKKHYKIVANLKDKVLSYLELEKVSDKIDALKKEIEINMSIKKRLKNEKENLQLYLKETINNFFYSELINKIYSKIDPHPDNYRIEFDCDFSQVNPRLQIYTCDTNDQKSVPALYFSTAQINILSLSIFLARALKTTDTTNKPINCIFIDDPIQSMDSINILSFIDLFRSLSINLGKQLIVSTHEENFHLLLQKKIPSNLFKSKFLRFETFGKLEKAASA
jgi:exonuclease SbcC